MKSSNLLLYLCLVVSGLTLGKSEKFCITGSLNMDVDLPVSSIALPDLPRSSVTVDMNPNDVDYVRFILSYTVYASNGLVESDVLQVSGSNLTLTTLSPTLSPTGATTPSAGTRTGVRLSTTAALLMAAAHTNNNVLYGVLASFLCIANADETCTESFSLQILIPPGYTYVQDDKGVTVAKIATPAPTKPPSPTPQPTNPPVEPTLPPTYPPTFPPTHQPTPPPTESKRCQKVTKMTMVFGKAFDAQHVVTTLQGPKTLLTGGQGAWNEYVEFECALDGPTNERLEAFFEFTVGALPTNPNGLELNFNYRGPNEGDFHFEVMTNSENPELLGDSSGSFDWLWSFLSKRIVLTNPLSEYVKDGKLTVRMTSPQTVKDPSYSKLCNLDFIELCVVDGGVPPAPTPPAPTPPPTSPPAVGTPAACLNPPDTHFTNWAYQSTLCGLSYPSLSDSDVDADLSALVSQGCNTVVLDTRLRYLLQDADFNLDKQFITNFAASAKASNLKTIVHFPALKVITPSAAAQNASAQYASSVQKDLANNNVVFNVYGQETAWMSPESVYATLYIQRAKEIAQIADVYAVWSSDLEFFDNSGTIWSGASTVSANAFKTWSARYCTGGCNLPSSATFTDVKFQAWLSWRHHSIAGFIERLRTEMKAAATLLIVESPNVDESGSTRDGFDASFYTNHDGVANAWVIDSVSSQNGMQYAAQEDLANQITMRKFAKSMDRLKPVFSFAHAGTGALDLGHVLSSAFAVGTATLEATKLSYWGTSASTGTRSTWYNWAKDHLCDLYQLPKLYSAAILFSTRSRDYYDRAAGSCKFIETATQGDTNWWTASASDSLTSCKHQGAYRGASYAMQMLNVQYKIVIDTQLTLEDLDDVKLLWLPSTVVLTDATIAVLKQYVTNGGTLLATGSVAPSSLTDVGGTRSATNPLLEVFGNFNPPEGQKYSHKYGQGVGIYRGDIDAQKFFINKGLKSHSVGLQTKMLKSVTFVIRTHVPETIIVQNPAAAKHLHVEKSIVTDLDTQNVYIVNTKGQRQPQEAQPLNIQLWYQAPKGKKVKGVSVMSPGKADGSISFNHLAGGWVNLLPFDVDKVVMLKVYLEDDTTPRKLPNDYFSVYTEEGMSFIANRMRDLSRDVPWRYGVFTNYIDRNAADELYAYARHTTSEHMGLFLRSSACLGKEQYWNESKIYIRDAMQSPALKLINWAIDKDKKQPFTTTSPYSSYRYQATAPLDDFRVIVGLLEGSEYFADDEAYEIATSALRGMFWTSVSYIHPNYPNGLVCQSYDWLELDPYSFGSGADYSDEIPVNYQDLGALEEAAKTNPRWIKVLQEGLDLILDSEINGSGRYYNTFTNKPNKVWAGDWENQNNTSGKHLKTIQELWDGIHLAKAKDSIFLSEADRARAHAAALRTWDFYYNFFNTNTKNPNSIPEYLTFEGTEVPLCTGSNKDICLDQPLDNSPVGEVRIHAQLARLGYYLGKDSATLNDIITRSVIPFRVTDPEDIRQGMFGINTIPRPGDADAWNTLEVELTLCLLQYPDQP